MKSFGEFSEAIADELTASVKAQVRERMSGLLNLPSDSPLLDEIMASESVEAAERTVLACGALALYADAMREEFERRLCALEKKP